MIKIEKVTAYNIDKSSNGISIQLVESAKGNVGKNGKYDGVGGHLYAFACKKAKKQGLDCVYFTAKSGLVEHYKEKLGAVLVFNTQMIIEDEAFETLIKKYYEEEF